MLQQKQSLYIHGIFKWLILILQWASFLGRMKQNVHMYLWHASLNSPLYIVSRCPRKVRLGTVFSPLPFAVSRSMPSSSEAPRAAGEVACFGAELTWGAVLASHALLPPASTFSYRRLPTSALTLAEGSAMHTGNTDNADFLCLEQSNSHCCLEGSAPLTAMLSVAACVPAILMDVVVVVSTKSPDVRAWVGRWTDDLWTFSGSEEGESGARGSDATPMTDCDCR